MLHWSVVKALHPYHTTFVDYRPRGLSRPPRGERADVDIPLTRKAKEPDGDQGDLRVGRLCCGVVS